MEHYTPLMYSLCIWKFMVLHLRAVTHSTIYKRFKFLYFFDLHKTFWLLFFNELYKHVENSLSIPRNIQIGFKIFLVIVFIMRKKVQTNHKKAIQKSFVQNIISSITRKRKNTF